MSIHFVLPDMLFLTLKITVAMDFIYLFVIFLNHQGPGFS